jgi:hypothetical protein
VSSKLGLNFYKAKFGLLGDSIIHVLANENILKLGGNISLGGNGGQTVDASSKAGTSFGTSEAYRRVI